MPSAVPSVIQSSAPPEPSSPSKTSRLPNAVGRQEAERNPSGVPGLMSLTRNVPASVPSEVQSSWPSPCVTAAKKRRPLQEATFFCELGPLPLNCCGETRTDPAAEPSLFQRSQTVVLPTVVDSPK